MLDDEPTSAARTVPLDLWDGNDEYAGTAPTGSEVLISICGAAWQQAAGTVTKLRNGDFTYEFTRAETRGRGFRLLRLAKTGMDTAIFEFYCGSRRANEPDALARRIPIMLELAGTPVTGVTLTGSEIEISINGAAFTTGTGTAGEIGYGAYYYEPPVSELARGYSLLNVNDAAADEYKYELIVDQAYYPTPGNATTAESIRDRIIAVIESLEPTSLSSDKFRSYRNETAGFIEWCESSTTGAFRRFQVTETGADEPPETSSVADEQRRATFQVIVAYPQTGRYGEDQALDRHDIMREDQRLIERAIGMTGAANFTSPYPDATWVSGDTARESGEACDFLVVSQTMIFVVGY